MGLSDKNKGGTDPRRMTGGFTVTGKGRMGVKAIRKEWTGPRPGDLNFRASKRPAQ